MNTIWDFASGRRWVTIAVSLFLLFLAASPLLAQTVSLPDRLPAETVFYSNWRGLAFATSAEKTNHVVQLFEDPQFTLGRDALLKSFRSSMAKNGSANSQPEIAEILSLLENPCVIGLVLNPTAAAAPGKVSADAHASPVGFFAVYDAAGKTALIQKLRAANRAEGKEAPTVMTYDFHGTKIEARTTGVDVSYAAQTSKFYFVADQKPVIEDLISRFTAANAPASTVTQLPEYHAVRPYVGSDAAVEFFARVPDLTKTLTPEQLDKPAVKFAQNLHIDKVQAFGGSLSFRGEAARFRGAMLGAASEGTLFDIAGPSGTGFITQPVVSPGPIFSISRIDLAALFRLFRAAAIPTLTAQQAATETMYENMAQGFLGMPLNDALQLFTGEVASQSSFADDGASLKTYAVSIQKSQDVLRILRALGATWIVAEDTAGDATFVDLAYPYTDPKTGQKRKDFYYVAVTPTMIFAAPRKAAVREAMSRLAAKSSATPASGVPAAPDFAHLRSLLPEKLSGLSAADIDQIPWDRIIARATQQSADAKNSGDPNASSYDWLQAVKPEVLTRHLHLAVSGWWKDSNGVYFDSYIQ